MSAELLVGLALAIAGVTALNALGFLMLTGRHTRHIDEWQYIGALRSSQWIGDGGPLVAPKRQVAGARGVSLHEARGPAIEDRFFLAN